MFLLLIGLGVLIWWWTNSGSSSISSKRCEKMHKWVLRPVDTNDKKGYLVCGVCGQYPGEE